MYDTNWPGQNEKCKNNFTHTVFDREKHISELIMNFEQNFFIAFERHDAPKSKIVDHPDSKVDERR